MLDPALKYGVDSGTTPQTGQRSFPCSTDFYIGRLGFGGSANYQFFDFTAASQVGIASTYSYWFVLGPAFATPPATTPDAAYAWGQAQADLASGAHQQAADQLLVVGTNTVFADIEQPTQYWNTSQALNQKVFEGFFNQLVNVHLLLLGVYSSVSAWSAIMGSGYGIPAGTPLWLTGVTNPPNVQCGVCPSSFPSLPTIGGISPSIWQYNISAPPCTDDLNVASSLPL